MVRAHTTRLIVYLLSSHWVHYTFVRDVLAPKMRLYEQSRVDMMNGVCMVCSADAHEDGHQLPRLPDICRHSPTIL